jgi:hypothetical protein
MQQRAANMKAMRQGTTNNKAMSQKEVAKQKAIIQKETTKNTL